MAFRPSFVSGLTLLLVCLQFWPQGLAADRAVRARWMEETITLDGVLSEAPWQLAEPATDFIQSEPSQGEPSSQRTEVRILFDSDNLYFGVNCFDSNPQGIVSNSLRRDFSPGDEDTFEILLDTFASSRDGFLFVFNPRGAKRDVQITNEGRESNVSWDAIWEIKTHINEQGWTAEILIPIKTLRYSKTPQGAWRINFGRQIRRNNERSYWSELPRRFNITRVSLAGELLGMTQSEIQPGRNLSLVPYVASNLTHQDSDTTSTSDVGVDLKYGLTSSLTLDLTYNTDFSHVEVDQQQVNLDRFRISFPEKRDFFLENMGLFEIGSVRLQTSGIPDPEDIKLFYSRRVGLTLARRPVPILGGARLTGRAGPYELGFINIQTEEAQGQGPENNSVLRVKRDILTRSWLGGFYLNRQGRDRETNQVYGVDGLYRPRDDLVLNSLFVQTKTPGIEEDDWAFRVEGLYDARWLRLGGTHATVQDDYRDDLGFAARTGVNIERLETRPRIRPWEGRMIREINPVLNIRYITDSQGRLITRKQSIGLEFTFQNGTLIRYRHRTYFDRLDEDFEIRNNIIVPLADYNYSEDGLEFTSDRSRALSGRFTFYDGSFWNGDKKSFLADARYRPNGHVSTSFTFTRSDVSLPGGDFQVDQLRFRLQYAFNTRTFLDTFIQYDSEDREITSNVRFNLIHHSLSDLFIVYTEENPTTSGASTDRVLSLKYTHLLGF